MKLGHLPAKIENVMASKFLVIAFILVLCAATTNCQIASGNLFTVISQTAGMNKVMYTRLPETGVMF